MTTWHVVPLIAAALLSSATMAGAQTFRVAPSPGYILHDEARVDRFVVQRWVSAANPEVSPAGFCECMTVIYEGGRRVFAPSPDAGITGVATLADVTGDRLAELVLSQHSGGAHCCYSTSIYSIESPEPRLLLSLNTDDCSGEIADLDGNGAAEFKTCDARFRYEFCSFAFTPFPPVVLEYNRQKGVFVVATPRYARYLQLPSENEALAAMKQYPKEAEVGRCAALGPALGLIYTGRTEQGIALFRRLYRGPDAMAIEQKALEMVRSSSLWVER